MRLWLLSIVAALGLAGCAAPGTLKMAWPERPPGSAPLDPAARAQGGGLEPAPQAALTNRSAEPELAPPSVPARVRSEAARLVLRWPLPATGVNSLFGWRRDPFDGKERRHNGVDLEAAYGAVVTAPADALVAWTGWNAGHGRQVVLSHAGGYQTSFSHLSQVLAVDGAQVRAGEPIGRVGNSGRSTGTHLHLEVMRYGVYLDPLDVLGVPLELN